MGRKNKRRSGRTPQQHRPQVARDKNPTSVTAGSENAGANQSNNKGTVPGILSGLPFGLQAGGLDRMTRDAFSNPLARIGADSVNMIEATHYTRGNITADFMQLNNLYRQNWVIKRLIDVVPEDMTKNWYKIESQLSPDAKKQISKLERRSRVRSKILEGMKWGRLYGGAAAVIMIEGHEDILDEPLDFDMIMPGTFKGLVILDRWSGISPSSSLVHDISDPDFGLPEFYNITTSAIGLGLRVHHSRIIRFIGRPLPYIEQVMELYWGSSEIEHILEELKKYDNTSYNIASLVFRANLNVYKLDGFDQLAVMPTEVQNDLYNTLTMMNWMMCNQGMQIIGPQDGFETHQYTFSGLSDIYEMFMLDISGAGEIPVTKLFGRSPAGMNSTGESDMQNYYDSIEEKQEGYLRPVIDKLLPIMCMSEFGAIPDDLDFKFNPCRRATEDEKKNIVRNTAQAVSEVFNAGIINQRIALTELRESSESTGMWGSISDEDIDSAETSFAPAGEEIPEPPDLDMDDNVNFNVPPVGNSPSSGGSKDFDPNQPRNPDGTFGSGGGSSSGSVTEKPDIEPVHPSPAPSASSEAGSPVAPPKTGKVANAGEPVASPTASASASQSAAPSSSEEVSGVTSEAEKQAKIDSIVINPDGDSTLPGLNKEELSRLGIEDKPVLLKQGIIEKNMKHHPDVSPSEYKQIVGSALYKPDAVLEGNAKKPYFNFISRTGPDKSAISLLQVKKTGSGNLEVVNMHWIDDAGRKSKEQLAAEIRKSK